jgi:hypothetical protein
VDGYLVMMLLGAAIAVTGIAMTAYTFLLTPAEGVDIGGGFVAVAGVVVLATGAALRGE